MFAVVVAIVVAFLKWKKSRVGPPAVGPLPPARAHEDRRHRAAGRGGALVAHARLAHLGAGVPLLLALDITGKTGGNVVVEEAMAGVIASVKRGGTISEPLSKAPIFPTMVTHMVGVGEETGALDAMLAKIADFYEDQVEASVKALTSILEPVMIIVIGSHRRLHRHLDVHAAVHDVQPHPVAPARIAFASRRPRSSRRA